MLSYFDKFSNWGRWGDDDELGAPNLITPAKVKQAVGLVEEGVRISMARTISFEATVDAPVPPVHFMVESGEGWASGQKVSNRAFPAATDYFGMIFHGYTVTHVDSLAHFFWNGKTYNGKPAHLVSTSLGATFGSVEEAKEGIISRAVLVDVPMVKGIDWIDRGEGVMIDDILAAEERCGFKVEEGDVLLIRTGQLHRRNVEGPWPREAGSAACQASCLPLFYERGIAMLGTDTGNDVNPPSVRKRPQSHTPGRHNRHGHLDPGQRKPGRGGRGLPRAQPLGVHDLHRPPAPAQHHRLPGQPHRHFLVTTSSLSPRGRGLG